MACAARQVVSRACRPRLCVDAQRFLLVPIPRVKNILNPSSESDPLSLDTDASKAHVHFKCQHFEKMVHCAGGCTRLACQDNLLSGRATISSVIPDGERGALPPPCSEPYCGGFHWNWKPPRPPRPFVTQPFPDLQKLQGIFAAGSQRGLQGLAPKTEEFDARDKYPKGSPALIKALEGYQHLKQRVLDPRALSRDRKLPIVSNDTDAARLDYYDADFYPTLHKPIAKEVQLLPATIDNYPTWLADRSTTMKIDREEDVVELSKHLNDFMRVQSRWVFKGKEILPGQRLLAVHPKDSNTMLSPFFGKEQLLNAGLPKTLPLTVTFGGKPAFEKPLLQDTPPVVGVKKVYPVVPVKRLDIVLRHKEDRGSPDLQPVVEVAQAAQTHPEEKTWIQKLFFMPPMVVVAAAAAPTPFRNRRREPRRSDADVVSSRHARALSASSFLS